MALVLPALLCLASGFLLVSLGWSRTAPLVADLFLRLSLSVGCGVGVFSIAYFLSRLAGLTNLMLVDFVVVGFLLLTFFFLRTRSTTQTFAIPHQGIGEPPWFNRVLTIAFPLALCAALYAALLRTLAHPHGDGWDAFAIWNLHARFLFLGGPHWRDAFSPLIPWSHPDYPLLLPAFIAHFWTFLGHDSPAVPAVVGFLFTFATVGLLCSSLFILRGRLPAMLGGLALLSTPAFFEVGAWQYSDIPLGFFFLATVALCCLRENLASLYPEHRFSGILVLAGLAAGLATWTKNEGLLFFCAMILARIVILMRRGEPRQDPAAIRTARLLPLLLGAAPVLLLVIYFKRFIVPPNDLFTDSATTIHKLLTSARYWAVIKWYTHETLRFGHWLFVSGTVLMLAYYVALGNQNRPRRRLLSFRIFRLALLLTLVGYFVIYLITPYEIYWHLRFSLDRLFLQLWPSTIFLFFLSVSREAAPHESGTPIH